jgi:alkyl sulfatase BDS1-like metallo-beta-lactamase superfamily hydrolase
VTSPYLGGPVEQVTGPKGQLANRRLVEDRQHIEPGIRELAPGLWTVVGLSVANAHVIDAPEGLIVIDTGNGIDEGAEIRRLIGTVSDRKIAALVYSHSHYVSGAAGLLGDDEVPIYGHVRLHDNAMRIAANTAPALFHRGLAQYGVPLPKEGPDANPIATRSAKSGSLGYRRPTQTWAENGLHTSIAGEPVVVYTDYSFDSNDSLILWFPERGACSNNHITATFPNMVSIAGGPYRDPLPWLDGCDVILRLGAEHLLGCHGLPTSGAEAVAKRVTAFRDALQFVYDQAVRGMNRGLSPDEILEEVRLPEHLAGDVNVAQSYSEWQFGLRAVYSGSLGWYSGDAVDLHPAPPSLTSQKIVAGFGGLDAACASVEQELSEACWSWAATLARHCVRVAGDDPALNRRPRLLLAQALRAMGQVSPAWTTRNAFLTQAGEWEGSLDRRAISSRRDPSVAASAPLGTWVRALGVRLDPVATATVDQRVHITFSDHGRTFGLHVRRGVAAFSPDPSGQPDRSITCTRAQWITWFYGLQAPPADWADFWAWFDAWR